VFSLIKAKGMTMQFVGIGTVHPIMLIPVIAGAVFYAIYLWGLSRLLEKTRFPRQYVGYAVLLDVALAMLGYGGWGRWLWNYPLHPPVPVSAFCALMFIAFASWPKASNPEAISN
jgi:hypothetical protein